MAKVAVLIVALFCVSGLQANTLVRPAPVEENTVVVRPLPSIVEPQIPDLTRPLPEIENPAAVQPEIAFPLPEAIVPEIEVLPIAPEAEACQTEEEVPEVIQVPEIEVIVPEMPQVKPQPIAPEVPEIEVVLPELNPLPEFEEVESCAAPELVRPLPEGVQVPEAVVPEIEVIVPEFPGVVRPLPVEENPSAVAPEAAIPETPGVVRPLPVEENPSAVAPEVIVPQVPEVSVELLPEHL